MKKILLLAAFSVMLPFVQAQQILSIEIFPAEPTVTDTISIIITNVFPSGGCDGTVEYNIFENSIFASSLHCLGDFTVICTDIDTLVINPIPQGEYNFVYTLSSGFGPPGECTPGIVPDDSETILFNVLPPLNVIEWNAFNFSAFPNPVKDNCTLQFESVPTGKNTLHVFDVYGRSIQEIPVSNTNSIQLNTSALTAGMYFLLLTGEFNNQSKIVRLVKQ